MKFSRITWFWVTDFGWPDLSFGIHFCMAGRIDIHILKWMISIGVVPLYINRREKEYAVSNSFHETKAGNPRGAASGAIMP